MRDLVSGLYLEECGYPKTPDGDSGSQSGLREFAPQYSCTIDIYDDPDDAGEINELGDPDYVGQIILARAVGLSGLEFVYLEHFNFSVAGDDQMTFEDTGDCALMIAVPVNSSNRLSWRPLVLDGAALFNN